ncbi:MAG: hypothetical protein EAZ92_16255 [Candidatus Kapaibacterium sp.]|nr:MAG: hypothetical protein EAZ92_16255 [Candidatus Kapabacteria bacterium]
MNTQSSSNSTNSTGSNYEFSPAQNTLISNLAKRLNFVGIAFIVLGVLQAFLAMVNTTMFGKLTGILGGALLGSLGVFMSRASGSFKFIVETEGQDIEHLMSALASLLSMYTAQFWSLVVLGSLVALITLQAVLQIL